MEFVFGILFGLVIFIAGAFFGGLLYLGAVWLNAREKGRGPWGRYSDWVFRKAAEIENKNKTVEDGS